MSRRREVHGWKHPSVWLLLFWISDAYPCSSTPTLIDLDSLKQNIQTLDTNTYSPILFVSAGGTPKIERFERATGEAFDYVLTQSGEESALNETLSKRYGPKKKVFRESEQKQMQGKSFAWIELVPKELSPMDFLKKFPAYLKITVSESKSYYLKLILNEKSVKTGGHCKFRPSLKPAKFKDFPKTFSTNS